MSRHLIGARRFLLADVPVQSEGVAEAGDQLTAIQLALDAEFAAIKGLADVPLRSTHAAAIVVGFILLEFEMQVEPEFGRVVEDDAPLVELRAIVMEFVFALRQRARRCRHRPPHCK